MGESDKSGSEPKKKVALTYKQKVDKGFMSQWQEHVDARRQKQKETHDHILKEHGLETEHVLAEYDSEDFFTYEEECNYPILEDIKREDGSTKTIIKGYVRESHEGITHMVQDQKWEAALIGCNKRLLSPYVLSEEEKQEINLLGCDNPWAKKIDESMDAIDETMKIAREHLDKEEEAKTAEVKWT